jgi:tetratricopeptide (TPR) repeat protein
VYAQTTQAFYQGLASLEVGLLEDAKGSFGRATELVPDEPAGWVNLGVTRMRLGDYDAASQALVRAAGLLPDSGAVALLRGQLEIVRGRVDEGLALLRRAVELDARNVRARFALAQEMERSGAQDGDAQAARELDAVLQMAPGNVVVLLERLRLAAKQSDLATMRRIAGRLDGARAAWPPLALEQYAALGRALEGNTQAVSVDAARAVASLRNVLAPTPDFQEHLAVVKTSDVLGEPFIRFAKLSAPTASPSPADTTLGFTVEPIGESAAGPWTALLAFSPDGTAAPVAVVAGARGPQLLGGSSGAFSSVAAAAAAGVESLVAVDWNHDFKVDVAIAGAQGVRLFLQQPDGTFADATAAAAAKNGGLTAAADGIWAADVDMDGDLDLIVGLRDGLPKTLRNNGDGTWTSRELFAGIAGVRAFAWGDLDGDGDPDAVFLDARGEVVVFENRQAGRFVRLGSTGMTGAVAIAIADVDADGAFEVLVLEGGGRVSALSRRGAEWRRAELVAWTDLGGAAAGSYRLWLADLDNNGALDIVASGAKGTGIWLGEPGGRFATMGNVPAVDVRAIADVSADGRLDLLGLENGQAVRALGTGRAAYHWQIVRARAQPTAGDQRINSFGIGGEVEVRAGLLTQKQVINEPVVHFGLGSRTTSDVARIVWPNGVMQAEFNRAADETVIAEQRLKGSCPWVFADDGSGMRFVTDFLWRSPLGLRINAQDTAGITQTEDWVKIRGDQMVPRDGRYDIRITAELWETHFVDGASLLVVDHPAGHEVYVDERFAAAAPRMEVQPTTLPRPVTRAWDQAGHDVSALVAKIDGRYVAGFARDAYQGLAEDHALEIELDSEIATDRQSWLLAYGWIYPTDSSINVAIGQGSHPQPRGLALEAQDPSGRWVVVSPDLGFPAGKNKTVLIDLGLVPRAGLPHARRLRLRTNLEIYWDWLAVADGADRASVQTTRLEPVRADLRARGYSQTVTANRESPETPQYDRIRNVGQRWRDLVGYYTRFGDVRELLARVDDRYVIMNAGDELRLQFQAPPSPPAGWRRDFVLIGDGWVKDGDFNTSGSKTVGPLPTHAHSTYESAADGVELQDDPVYKRHSDDWVRFHTRAVTPRRFVRGLERAAVDRPPQAGAAPARAETP